MKVIVIDDSGERHVIKARKIEPATLSRRNQVIIDEDHVINLDDIVAIID